MHNNIEVSSNDIDTTTIFNRFLPPIKRAHHDLKAHEVAFLKAVEEFTEREGPISGNLRYICLHAGKYKDYLRIFLTF